MKRPYNFFVGQCLENVSLLSYAPINLREIKILDRKELGRDTDNQIVYSYRVQCGITGIELWIEDSILLSSVQ